MRKIYLIFCLLISIAECLAHEHTVNKSKPVYVIKDGRFAKILDCVIESDRNKKYYWDNLQYEIRFGPNSNFEIQATNEKCGLGENDIGVVCHSGHKFVINVTNKNFAIDEIFQRTDSYVTIRYWPHGSYIDSSGTFVLCPMLDDGQSWWVYSYNNGNYTLLSCYKSILLKK